MLPPRRCRRARGSGSSFFLPSITSPKWLLGSFFPKAGRLGYSPVSSVPHRDGAGRELKRLLAPVLWRRSNDMVRAAPPDAARTRTSSTRSPSCRAVAEGAVRRRRPDGEHSARAEAPPTPAEARFLVQPVVAFMSQPVRARCRRRAGSRHSGRSHRRSGRPHPLRRC
jgi:hypothetical protein